MTSSATDMNAPLLTADSKSSDVVVSIDEKTPVLTPLEQHLKKLQAATKAVHLIETELPIAEALEVKRADRRGRNARIALFAGGVGSAIGVWQMIETAFKYGAEGEADHDAYNNFVGPNGEKCPQPMPDCNNGGGGGESIHPTVQSMSGLTDITYQCNELLSSYCSDNNYDLIMIFTAFAVLIGVSFFCAIKPIRNSCCIKEKAIELANFPEDKKTELSTYRGLAEMPEAILIAPLANIRSSFFARKIEFKNDPIYKKFLESKRTAAGFKSLGKDVKDIKKEDYKPIHRLFSNDGKGDLTKHILSYIELLPESNIKMLKRG